MNWAAYEVRQLLPNLGDYSRFCPDCGPNLSSEATNTIRYPVFEPRPKPLQCLHLSADYFCACSLFEMAAFWNFAPCSVEEIYQCFRGACWLHNQVIFFVFLVYFILILYLEKHRVLFHTFFPFLNHHFSFVIRCLKNLALDIALLNK
jgi:hypothetical protein